MTFFFSKNPGYRTSQLGQTVKSGFVDKFDMAQTIGCLLSQTIESNIDKALNADIYYSSSVPEISIEAYLLRFMQYTTAEEGLYISMLIYLNKYLGYYPEKYLNSLNAHRLLTASFLLAFKFHCDDYNTNYFSSFSNSFSFFARIAGVSIKELHRLELQFFYIGLQCNLYVPTEEYEEYRRSVLDYQCS